MTITAVTLDFGNTLVPVSAGGLRGVVVETARRMAAELGPFDEAEVLRVWGEERERQFREEVPQFREVDLSQRLVRILARLRGMPPRHPTSAGTTCRRGPLDHDEAAWAIDVYSRAFVTAIPPAPAAGALLERLHGAGYRLAILSNWPLALTIDRYAEAAGWSPLLHAIVVSQRVGTIKPHPAIFDAARVALGGPDLERSSTWGTTGRPTSSGRNGPAGGPRGWRLVPTTRRCRARSVTRRSWRTLSSRRWTSWRRRWRLPA